MTKITDIVSPVGRTSLSEFINYSQTYNDKFLATMEYSPLRGTAVGSAISMAVETVDEKSTASSRNYGTDFESKNAGTSTRTYTLVPIGGKFKVDRAVAKHSDPKSKQGAIAQQANAKVIATKAELERQFINGKGQDNSPLPEMTGLSKVCELNKRVYEVDLDLTDHTATIDEMSNAFLQLFNVAKRKVKNPNVLYCSSTMASHIETFSRKLNSYTEKVVDTNIGLVQEYFGNIIIVALDNANFIEKVGAENVESIYLARVNELEGLSLGLPSTNAVFDIHEPSLGVDANSNLEGYVEIITEVIVRDYKTVLKCKGFNTIDSAAVPVE